ncbi:hypothetical protein ACOMHN_021803 [Nucella lapillus]
MRSGLIMDPGGVLKDDSNHHVQPMRSGLIMDPGEVPDIADLLKKGRPEVRPRNSAADTGAGAPEPGGQGREPRVKTLSVAEVNTLWPVLQHGPDSPVHEVAVNLPCSEDIFSGRGKFSNMILTHRCMRWL